MREILFRGKKIYQDFVDGKFKIITNNEWVYGDLYHLTLRDCGIDTCGWTDTDYFDPLDEFGDAYDVDSETVGQYTGLKDKNGKRIFEGDVLQYNDGDEYDPNEFAVVTWEDAAFVLKYYCGRREPFLEYQWASSNKYFEVIGNIHDNPELLEGEN